MRPSDQWPEEGARKTCCERNGDNIHLELYPESFFIWTSLTCTTTPAVLARSRLWNLVDVRQSFVDAMSQRLVQTPMQLIGWLRTMARDISQRRAVALEHVSREADRMTMYAYLSATMQEYIMDVTRIGPRLQKAGFRAVRDRMGAANRTATSPARLRDVCTTTVRGSEAAPRPVASNVNEGRGRRGAHGPAHGHPPLLARRVDAAPRGQDVATPANVRPGSLRVDVQERTVSRPGGARQPSPAQCAPGRRYDPGGDGHGHGGGHSNTV
jgi:hypothetical protein